MSVFHPAPPFVGSDLGQIVERPLRGGELMTERDP